MGGSCKGSRSTSPRTGANGGAASQDRCPILGCRCPRRAEASAAEGGRQTASAEPTTALPCGRPVAAEEADQHARARAKTRRGTRRECGGGGAATEGAGALRAGGKRVGGRGAPLLPGCTVCPSRRGLPRDGARREHHRTSARGVRTPGVSRRGAARAPGWRASGGRRGRWASEPEGLAVQRRRLPRPA